MKTRAVIVGVMAAWLLSVSALEAQELRYWGKASGARTGRIELQPGQYYEVKEGDEIPGWGRVKEIGDRSLIVEQALTEADQESLRRQGMLAYEVLEIKILRTPLPSP